MPYSISHAVVAWPLSRLSKKALPIPAIVVGSISPDFSYFITLTTTNLPSHSVKGVFIYCLLPSILLLSIWYRWLETPTLKLFHVPKCQREFRLSNIFIGIIALLIGAFSHVLWDASSHSYGGFVKQYEFLSQSIVGLPLYKWNQYLSGIIGLLMLFLWYISSVYRNSNAPYQGHLKIGLSLYAGFILVFVVLSNILHGSQQLSEYAVRSSIGAVTGSVFAAVIYAVYTHLLCRKA